MKKSSLIFQLTAFLVFINKLLTKDRGRKMDKKLSKIPIILIFTLLLSAPWYLTCGSTPDNPVMYTHYIKVGQGDATLLEFPCGAILIDAGAQDNTHIEKLITYLTGFFSKRSDLNNTLETVFITHNHSDHTNALKEIITNFKVKRLIHDGKANISGTGDLCWALREKDQYDITVEAVTFEKVTASGNKNGFTSSVIDPIQCNDCDPEIIILSGGFEQNPGWSHEDFDNKNNHSLIIRVDFNESSFIFTGDLQESGINKIVEYYHQENANDPNLFDIDVYQVGHHGSHNATTADLLEAMTPEIAIISVGSWDYGRDSGYRRSTYWYGHPRKNIIDLMTVSLKKYRSKPINAMVALGSRNFTELRIRKKIYATAWDGNIKVRATPEGKFRVTRNN